MTLFVVSAEAPGAPARAGRNCTLDGSGIEQAVAMSLFLL